MSEGSGPELLPFRRRATIVVFAKAPRAGLVKTRMTPPLSPEQAAELYDNLLDDALATTSQLSKELDLDPVVAVFPEDACGEIVRRTPPRFQVVAQRGNDLGERMGWAVAEAAAGGATRILLRGSDCPVLGVELVRAALEELERVDLVVSPDLGGGYSLIGLRRPTPGLFDHPMSTHSVLDDTLANARRLGLEATVLAPSFDLDEAADFAHLARARREGRAGPCPRTLAHMDDHDLWSLAPPVPGGPT